MLKQGVDFEEVFDKFAIRIIVEANAEDEKSLCWRIYSIVTDFYKPNPDRLRDWISNPKANGYEALHTTVMGRMENGLKFKLDQKEWIILRKKVLLLILNIKTLYQKIQTLIIGLIEFENY